MTIARSARTRSARRLSARTLSVAGALLALCAGAGDAPAASAAAGTRLAGGAGALPPTSAESRTGSAGSRTGSAGSRTGSAGSRTGSAGSRTGSAGSRTGSAASGAGAVQSPATGAEPPVGSSSPTPPGGIVPLSNETTLTTWAHPEIEGVIRVSPTPRGRMVARVHLYTEDGFPEVYLLLSRFLDGVGREWVRVRVPGRPNGRTGWMLRELLGAFHSTQWRIVVDRERHRMRVYYDGQLRRVFPVGVGKSSTPTPPGHFWVRERFRLSGRSNPYGPYALGTSDYSTLSEWPGGGVVGIHGDFGEPQRIPGDPSHGCIRMHDADIGWLGPRVSLGTPVEVL